MHGDENMRVWVGAAERGRGLKASLHGWHLGIRLETWCKGNSHDSTKVNPVKSPSNSAQIA